jgi:hypothetical protein
LSGRVAEEVAVAVGVELIIRRPTRELRWALLRSS